MTPIAAVSGTIDAGRAATRRPTGRIVAILALIAIAARAVDFGNPIIFVDEEFYFVAARAIAHGALPYVDIWDRKPIGLFLTYLPAGLFDPPIGIWIYQLLASICVVATAWLIYRMAERAGWERGALIAAVLYIVWLDFADGQGGQSPVFYNLPMAGAAALIQAATSEPGLRLRRGLAAMALTGIAMQIKYAAVFEGLYFGFWLLLLDVRARVPLRRVAARGALLAAAAIAPTAVAVAVYALIGQLHTFLFANFASILARHADPIGDGLSNLLVALAILAPLLALDLAGLPGEGESTAERRFLRIWLAAALGGFLIFGGWFNHYTLPVMVPACACAAALLGRSRHGRTIGWAIALVALIVGQIVIVRVQNARGTPTEFARVAAAVGHGPGALYVYSGSTMLYATSGRPMLSRYVFPTHLMLSREAGAIGVDQAQEINRILDQHPAVVVVQARDPLGERADIRAMLLARLARDGYRAIATLPYGHYPNTVYRASSR
jgi:hypothetical protein